MKLKYLLLCATLSVAFAVLASENGKTDPGKSDVMVADICLKPEIQSETDYKNERTGKD